MDEVDRIIFALKKASDDLKALKAQEPGNQRLYDAEDAIDFIQEAIDVLIPF